MKILVNAISARKGGVVTYTLNLMRSLRKLGIDATYAVPEHFPEEDGINILRVQASDYGPFRRYLWEQTKWRNLVKSTKPDILFSSANFAIEHCPVPQVLLVREGGLFDPLYLNTMPSRQGTLFAIERILRRRLIRRSMNISDAVLMPSMAMRDLLAQWEPRLASKFIVNHYGTPEGLFFPTEPQRPWREDGTLRLLYVSFFYPHKCPGVIVEATRQLCAQGIKAHVTLTTTLDELKLTAGNEVDYKIIEQGEKDGLVTLGHVAYSKVPELLKAHDIFVFPSISETFGHPMVEALACGVPVVAADTPINREICGDVALYHPPFMAEDARNVIQRLDQDPALRKRMFSDGPRRVKELFTWDDHVKPLLNTFEETATLARN